MFEFAGACIGLAGVFATAAAATAGGVYHRDVKSVAAPKGKLVTGPIIHTKGPVPGPHPDSAPGPTNQPLPPATEYLSDAYPVDQDTKADTADVEEGGYKADGTHYDHAIKMNAGCENGDGGDMWAEWNLDRKWNHLTGTVALEDDANSSSSVTYAVYLDGRKTRDGGTLKIGQSATINLNVSGVYRVRLWMNDPDAPTNDCGTGPFPVPNFIWGNLTATSS